MSTLAAFQISEEIGKGSFGTVYRAVHLSTSRTVVLKTVRIDNLSASEVAASLTEAQALSMFDNDFVVQYFSSFVEDGSLHIIMEYCPGGTLFDEIRSAKKTGSYLDEAVIWSYFLQMCLGLHHIHSKGVLHRDMKSENIFFSGDSRVRIGDLGVAKLLESAEDLTRTFVGTPYYLSPELCEGKSYNEKSDVWSLGCILYEMCTLQPPFHARNRGALMMRIVRGKFAPISSRYSKALAVLVTKLLSRSSADRPRVLDILLDPVVRKKARKLDRGLFDSMVREGGGGGGAAATPRKGTPAKKQAKAAKAVKAAKATKTAKAAKGGKSGSIKGGKSAKTSRLQRLVSASSLLDFSDASSSSGSDESRISDGEWDTLIFKQGGGSPDAAPSTRRDTPAKTPSKRSAVKSSKSKTSTPAKGSRASTPAGKAKARTVSRISPKRAELVREIAQHQADLHEQLEAEKAACVALLDGDEALFEELFHFYRALAKEDDRLHAQLEAGEIKASDLEAHDKRQAKRIESQVLSKVTDEQFGAVTRMYHMLYLRDEFKEGKKILYDLLGSDGETDDSGATSGSET